MCYYIMLNKKLLNRLDYVMLNFIRKISLKKQRRSFIDMKNIPDPATPTVAAPAPMNLAAESISLVTEVVWKDRTADN